jgi:hypothetical protein
MNSENVNLTELEEPAPPMALRFKQMEPMLLFVLLLFTWFFAPAFLQGNNSTVGMADPAMWVLLILSMIGFLMICGISWWILKHFWLLLGLPDLKEMVSQFNTLQLWQQLSFFLASFVSLLLVAMGCLAAVL